MHARKVHMSKEEERMNEMKMAMCMSTAHDVKTPLASLGIVISSLRSNADVDENCTKLLDEAIVNVEVLNLVATQFMDIGMMGSGVKIKATIDALNVVTMLNRIENVRPPPCILFLAHRRVFESHSGKRYTADPLSGTVRRADLRVLER